MSRLKGYTRDEYNQAVISVDNEAYHAYLKGREGSIRNLLFERETIKKVMGISKEVTSLKEDLDDIKSLLVELAGKKAKTQTRPKKGPIVNKKVKNG